MLDDPLVLKNMYDKILREKKVCITARFRRFNSIKVISSQSHDSAYFVLKRLSMRYGTLDSILN